MSQCPSTTISPPVIMFYWTQWKGEQLLDSFTKQNSFNILNAYTDYIYMNSHLMVIFWVQQLFP